MTSEFAGLVAVVTGGASGIGASVVERLLTGGAKLAVIDLSLAGAHVDAFAIQSDVSDPATTRAALGTIAAELGGIDIVVNSAGVGAIGSVEAVDEAEWARVLSINVTGMARVVSSSLAFLRQSRAAAVVNVASVAATTGLPSRALYSASKGAVLSLTRAMAADHLREGIRVNAVNPGTADTPWVARLLESAADPAGERAALAARQPHGRLVDPIEIAEAVAYLASPRNKSTTGIAIAVDGGMQNLRLRPIVD